MVHTRNGRSYSVQPDGCGQGRGKTKSRSVKSSSGKTHMEDAIVAPHSPRSVPTNFDVNSESGLIHDNIPRAEQLPSGSNGNLSMPIQQLIQSSQRRGVGNMPKPLTGGHELLLTHQELSESGDDHRTLRRLEPIFLQRQGQKDKEFVEEPKSFIHRPEEETGNDFSFGDRRPSGIYQLQTSSRSVQGQSQRTSEEEERSQEPSRKEQSQSQLAQTLPTMVQDPQIGAFRHGHDSERQKFKNEIIANVEQIHKNYEPHIPRNSTPLTEEKRSVKESLTSFLGENVISAKDIPKLEQWPTFSGEGEYNHIEFIRTIDMLQEDFHIPDETIVGKLDCLFTKTAKKWYDKMRLDNGKHDWSWWKSEVITKCENNSWRFKMENAFESAIFN
ncbi:hypothetical protein O181_076967 [Austropuccinia psidii MF-1]|uniref:Retrotransposon gag domain-containing protein n=1 Tax=Austropuccinia psidii MF-1 TaxID=1389203 RepID=A0A9Q3IE99_9BASI|nr:hypothetical protein [Austropuccinia psidii MF-1]